MPGNDDWGNYDFFNSSDLNNLRKIMGLPPLGKKKSTPVERPKKHIKYQAELVPPDFKLVRVSILEQTHLRTGFGEESFYRRDSFTHGNITLKSYRGPMKLWYDDTVFYLRGDDSSDDKRPIFMSRETYADFKKAVNAYNSHFSGDKEEKEQPKEEAKKKPRKMVKIKVDTEGFAAPKAEAKPEPWRDRESWRRYYR